MINYEDFAKLDIRVGKIISAEIMPDADRLLKLSVDIGEDEPRTIVSGIREYFPEPEKLVGKNIPILTNLEPRTLRGVESQGMILAASDDDAFSLLEATTPLSPGAGIK
ncbi:methionine--tRNA ligase subunit beta [Candidatus Wolfebacteria bacterium]|nr:MAG: methionine--tRNA ligase subunit beta [Candidatus Wolfebacteria bacterium]